MIFTNRKGQAITEPFVLFMVIAIVAVISIGMFTFGQDVAADPNNTLDNESTQYIFDRSGFDPRGGKDADNVNDTFFTSPSDTGGSEKDFTLEFQYYREQSSQTRLYLNNVWNLPSFFVEGLGLDLDNWTSFINLWNSVVWLMVFYAIYRIIRGRIR